MAHPNMITLTHADPFQKTLPRHLLSCLSLNPGKLVHDANPISFLVVAIAAVATTFASGGGANNTLF